MSHENIIQVGDRIEHTTWYGNTTRETWYGTVIGVLQPSRADSETRLVVVTDGRTLILSERECVLRNY